MTRRDWLRSGLGCLPLGLAGCAGGGLMSPSARKVRAQWEFRNRFMASGAYLRYRSHSAHGRPWTTRYEQAYRAYRGDPRVGSAAKNPRTGLYFVGVEAA